MKQNILNIKLHFLLIKIICLFNLKEEQILETILKHVHFYKSRIHMESYSSSILYILTFASNHSSMIMFSHFSLIIIIIIFLIFGEN